LHSNLKLATQNIISMSLFQYFKTITSFVFDVDGVLTDGNLLLYNDGQMTRQMNIKDGYALQLAIKKGYRVAIISGSFSDAVHQRLDKLGIRDIFSGVTDKKEKLIAYCMQYGLKWEQVLYMGDDIPDFMPMQMAGLPCCPADAVGEIRNISVYISPFNGGFGCARDVIEKVLKINGHWQMDATVSSK
jgi:3-deoxy-D-manno-octulosonate 8-phosphate phosphatase (KDO 8-P phosphatase)